MSTEPTTESRAERAANLFDLRRIIGGLFTVWGVLLTILGAGESQAAIDKAAGININLFAGIGMLIFGVGMLLWAFTRPLGRELASEESGGRTRGDDDAAGGERGPGT